MKNLRTVLLVGVTLAVTSLAFSARAQEAQPPPPVALDSNLNLDTNGTVPVISGPATQILDFLSHGTNWMVATYGIYASDPGHGHYGGGLALGYKLSEFVVPIMRLDYLDGTIWMPSASLQLQAPITLMGKVTVIPFGFAGIATPIAGKGKDNGTVVGIFGAGAAARLDFLGDWGKHVDLVADMESWSSFKGNQYRLGLMYKF